MRAPSFSAFSSNAAKPSPPKTAGRGFSAAALFPLNYFCRFIFVASFLWLYFCNTICTDLLLICPNLFMVLQTILKETVPQTTFSHPLIPDQASPSAHSRYQMRRNASVCCNHPRSHAPVSTPGHRTGSYGPYRHSARCSAGIPGTSGRRAAWR